MTRTLVFIAFAGFVLAVACIAGALALGGNELLHHNWNGRHWSVNWDDDHRNSGDSGGANATREIAWPGGDRIEFDVPGDVQFTQAPGPAKLTITGPKDQIDHIQVSGDRLRYDDDDDFDDRVTIVMTAPDVRHFAINGSDSLTIAGFDQDDLGIDVSGEGQVTAKGRARAVKLAISGDGRVDLSGVASQTAEADISGSGKASIAPSDEAKLDISGSGEIELMSRPAKLTSDISGSGRIVEGTVAASAPPAAAPAPAAPPPPAAPAQPAKPAKAA
jgi:hypothetical protein